MAKPAGENTTNTNFDVEVRTLFGGGISKLDTHQIRGDVSNSHGSEFHSDQLVAEILKKTEYSSSASLRKLQAETRPFMDKITDPIMDFNTTAMYVQLLHMSKSLLLPFLHQIDPSFSDAKIEEILQKEISLKFNQTAKVADITSGWLINFLRSQLGIQYAIMDSGLNLNQEYRINPTDTIDSTKFLLGQSKYWKRRRILIAESSGFSDTPVTWLEDIFNKEFPEIPVHLLSNQPVGDKRSTASDAFYATSFYEDELSELEKMGAYLRGQGIALYMAPADSSEFALKVIRSKTRKRLFAY